MSVSVAELNSRVFLSLDMAAEFLSLDKIHNAVAQWLNIRTQQSRMSAENVLLATSDEFTVTDLDHDITSLIGKGVISFVETHWADNDTLESWQNIRIVPLSQFNDYKQTGALACSYYAEDPANATSQATQYLKFTFSPGAVCRIRYDRDSERKGLSNDILLPDNIAEMIVREAQNTLIPAIQTAIAARMRSDEELRKFGPAITIGLEAMKNENNRMLVELKSIWKNWAFRDRSAESSFNNPTPRSGNMYPGGRTGYGYGGWGSGNS